HDRNQAALPLQRGDERRPLCEDHVGLQCDQFFRLYLRLICAAIGRKASVHADIATLRPSTLFKPLPKSREARRHFRIVLGQGRQHGDPANSVGLLRAGGQRPRGRRAAEKRDELAPFYLIELHPVPASQGGVAGYRIASGQSGGSWEARREAIPPAEVGAAGATGIVYASDG